MEKHQLKIVIAFFAIYIVWGSTFFFVKMGLQSFTPFLFSTLRFLIGGFVLLLYAVIQKEKFPTLSELPKYILSGIVVFMGGVVAVVWAQQFMSSSLAAAIITTPFWFIVLDKTQWSLYFSNKKIIIGLLLGLLGVLILATQKTNHTQGSSDILQLLGILVMIGGSFFWVAGSLYLKYQTANSSIIANTAVQLLSAGVVCSIITVLNGETSQFVFQNIQTSAWFALIYLSIASTALTYLAFLWLIKIKPPAIVSTYSYVNPLVATLLGWLFAHETIGFIQLMALTLILFGVLFVNLGKTVKI
jgi:drug/metabolite transporter (DMT)-like permease